MDETRVWTGEEWGEPFSDDWADTDAEDRARFFNK